MLGLLSPLLLLLPAGGTGARLGPCLLLSSLLAGVAADCPPARFCFGDLPSALVSQLRDQALASMIISYRTKWDEVKCHFKNSNLDIKCIVQQFLQPDWIGEFRPAAAELEWSPGSSCYHLVSV